VNFFTEFALFIFYGICNEQKLASACAFGKKAQVWKTTNFDAGLYDITGFLWALTLSTYLYFVDILVSGKKSIVRV
jgi:hypothetical protein